MAAKELAKREGRTAGQVISDLARKALRSGSSEQTGLRNGVPVLPSRGEIITLESIKELMDKEGV